MAERIVLFSERTAQTVVNDIANVKKQELAFRQITAISQSQLQSSPPGTTPPFILSYRRSSPGDDRR
jgi:hypothetical protein